MVKVLQIRRDDVAWQEVEDEVIVLDSTRSLYLRLSGAAPVLWPLLVEGTTRDDLAGALVDEFGLDRDRAEADVDVFLDGLDTHGLLGPGSDAA